MAAQGRHDVFPSGRYDVSPTISRLLSFQHHDGFEVRGAGEQIERLHFAHAVAVAFPFLEGCGNLVGAAEHVAVPMKRPMNIIAIMKMSTKFAITRCQNFG